MTGDRVADPATTLAEHHPEHGRDDVSWFPGCSCGWWTSGSSGVTDNDREAAANIAHARHVLSVLSATHAIIELPEGTTSGDMTQWGGEDGDHVWCAHGMGKVRLYIEDARLTSQDAVELAAKLLAAARRAEETGQ